MKRNDKKNEIFYQFLEILGEELEVFFVEITFFSSHWVFAYTLSIIICKFIIKQF